MPTRHLPKHSDLRHLKLQARSLHKACLAGQPEALSRLARRRLAPGGVTLSTAQTIVAREYGARSWPNLVARVEALRYVYAPPEQNAPPPARALLRMIVELLPQHWGRCQNALIRAGDAGINALIEGLDHRTPKVRTLCAQVFDHHRDPRGIEALRHHAGDRVPRVRQAVIHSLACERCSGSPLLPEHVDVVQRACLTDDSAKVRREAAYLLGQQMADVECRQTLHRMLAKETDPDVRMMAQLGLSNHGRGCFGGKPEAELRHRIGVPHHIEERKTAGPPRMLYYDVAALTGLAAPAVSPPAWLRFIIKNERVGCVTVLNADVQRV